MFRIARIVSCGLVLLAVTCGAVGCSSSSDEAGRSSDEAEIEALCLRVGAIQNQVVEAGNAMSSAEVGADPVERAEILAAGLESMIDAVRQAELPTEPRELASGIPDRRDRVVADAETEAAEFRTRWPRVESDERGETVQGIFVVGEKLMSEVEPRIAHDTAPQLIEIVRATPSCRHVIQLPRVDG